MTEPMLRTCSILSLASMERGILRFTPHYYSSVGFVFSQIQAHFFNFPWVVTMKRAPSQMKPNFQTFNPSLGPVLDLSPVTFGCISKVEQ